MHEVYLGREKPVPVEWGGRLPVALVYPQRYELGISTLGWQSVYRILSGDPGFAVERFFLDPSEGAPRSHDFKTPLELFPVVAFSLTFEFDSLGLVQILDQARIPPVKKERQDWPLVMAGGPLAFLNPVPLEPTFDLFFVGEAEESLPDLLHALREKWLEKADKFSCLHALKNLPGAWVPGLSRTPVARTIAGIDPEVPPVPASSCFISSRAEFRDTLLLEVNRGCPHGCRFCAAGYMYRPPRVSDENRLKEIVRSTVPRKVGLVGTALTDWEPLLPFLTWLHERDIRFSLSSLRADKVTWELLSFLRRTGTRSLTFALEGASSRLRRAMNKRMDEESFLQAVTWASSLQFNHLKIYLIVGWPGERDEDYDELSEFVGRLDQAVKQGKGGKKTGLGRITLNASCLVPKPWTPMQWAPMAGERELKKAMDRIRNIVKGIPRFRFQGDRPFLARIQGLVARGDEKVHTLILAAARNKGSWKKGLEATSFDMSTYLDRERGEDEPFPWEIIEIGVDREFLWKEWQGFLATVPSPRCPGECSSCGLCGMSDFLDEVE